MHLSKLATIGLLFLSTFVFCQKVKPIKFKFKQKDFEKIENPFSRLCAIYAGTFHYKAVDQAGPGSLQNKDLVLTVSPIWEDKGIGNWYYEEGFLLSLPFEPVSQIVCKLERTNSNTFTKTRYAVLKPEKYKSAWADPSRLKTFDQADLLKLPGVCDINFKESEMGHFAADTCGLCPRNLGNVAYLRVAYDLNINGQCILLIGYSKDGKRMGPEIPCQQYTRDFDGLLLSDLKKQYWAALKRKE